VRELVYLSESKMEQFIPDLSSLWPKPRITIKTPFAGLDLDMSSTRKKSQLKHLKLIVKQIERSARWFGDQYLCAGEWAAFEAPLNYLTMKCGESVQVLFFVDPARPVDNYASGGTRLLLHGSPGNLIDSHTIGLTAPQPDGEQSTLRFSSDPAAYGSSHPKTLGYVANNVGALMGSFSRISATATSPHQRDCEAVVHWLPKATAQILSAIDGQVYPETAAWMKGYARITAILTAQPASFEDEVPQDNRATRYIVATPLYVERSSPPQNIPRAG
jgi:hypothetical protein